MTRRPPHVIAAVVAVACAIGLTLTPAAAARPYEQSDLLTFDVQLTPRKEGKIEGLQAKDFKVKVAGKSRSVVTATFAHLDEGDVVSAVRPEQARPDCVFGFLRRMGLPTAHYVLGVAMPQPNRSEASQIRVTLNTSKFAVDRFAYRTPRQ